MTIDDGDIERFLRPFGEFVELALERSRKRPNPFLERVTAHLGAPADQLPTVSAGHPDWQLLNLQAALDAYVGSGDRTADTLGIQGSQKAWDLSLSSLLKLDSFREYTIGPVEYSLRPNGPNTTRHCLSSALVLLPGPTGPPIALLIQLGGEHGSMRNQFKLEAMASDREAAVALLDELRRLMSVHNQYRGQMLSLVAERYGEGVGVQFHSRPVVTRDDIVLPDRVLDRIERHVVRSPEDVTMLVAEGHHLKRGVLLHGPPGTGKTHTVRYLTTRCPDATVIVISGRAFGALQSSCEMARSLAPSLVVLEDVDLIARDRSHSSDVHTLLYELLNEMDGIADDGDVAFVLTTNRADILEKALVERPGRIDLAVDYPRPDATARRRLVTLYGKQSTDLTDLDAIVERTDGMTASFFKELMRRAWLVARRDGRASVLDRDVHSVLDDLLSADSVLTRSLLSGPASPEPDTDNSADDIDDMDIDHTDEDEDEDATD